MPNGTIAATIDHKNSSLNGRQLEKQGAEKSKPKFQEQKGGERLLPGWPNCYFGFRFMC